MVKQNFRPRQLPLSLLSLPFKHQYDHASLLHTDHRYVFFTDQDLDFVPVGLSIVDTYEPD